MTTRTTLLRLLLAPLLSLLLCITPSGAQDAPDAAVEKPPPFEMLEGLEDFGDLGGFLDAEGDELTLSGQLKVEKGGRDGILEVKAELASKWHVYALDQEGGPGPAKISVKSPQAIQTTGPFRPDREPKVREVEYFEVPLREHYGEVTWTAPIRLADGVDPETVELDVQFDGQICSDEVGCKPKFGEPIPVTFGGYLESGPTADPAPTADRYRAERSYVELEGHIEPASVAPGGSVKLVLTASVDPGWHIYAYAPKDPQEVAKPTLIVLSEPSSWTAGPVEASSQPVTKPATPDEPAVAYHDGGVTWTVEIEVPGGVDPGDYEIAGLIGYQTCTDTSCDRPRAAKFTATVTVGDAVSDQPQPLSFTADRYGEAARLAATGSSQSTASAEATAAPGSAETASVDDTERDTAESGTAPVTDTESPLAASSEINLGLALVYAFLGGLILNVMPCVLPVIGLKIMAFVQQAGESRGKIFTLNVWYSLGLISVFLVLATIAAVWNVGWGQHFGNEAFAITMAALVFVMGLSFLGVWEIPIPGFVGGAKANEMADKEGPAGAFAKGAITTVLATPCSGPGIAVALGYCTGKPAGFVYLIFAMLGLGMASPYLLIGAFPKLIRFLPKPGMWMETFKQVMGFVLMGTVIYLLSFIDWSSILPTLALLLGLAGGFWWIGRTPITADFQVRLRAWLVGAAFACVLGLYAFSGKTSIGGYEVSGLQGVMEHRLDRFVMVQSSKEGDIEDLLASPQITQHDTEIRWVPFTEQRLNRLIEDNRTVMIDFTADWCLTCKALEATVLNTQEVRDSLRRNGVVALLADWTRSDPEISRMLESLGSKQVPVLAIFPAGRPDDRIVLMGGYTKATLLEKLNEAGPSQDAGVDAPDRVAGLPAGGS